MAGNLVLLVTFVALFSLNTMAEGDILVYIQEPPRFIEEEYRDMPAHFGGVIASEGLRAFVIAGSPKDGCSAMAPRPTPSTPNFTGKWVVLVARYNCSFEAKVRNAQSAGFDGVIVHNVNSSELEIMSAKNPEGIKIPSVFVSEDTGIIMENNYQYNNGYFVVINGDLPFNINTHLLLPFAIVVGLCLVIMTIFMIVKCVRDRRRARRHRLPKSALKKIPTSKFAKGDPYDICAICLDDYVEGDKLRVLPCSHAYHCKCIDPWLTKNRRVCPVCKRKVFASGERRPAPRDVAARRGHDSSSGSDTDDDRAPLVTAAAGNRTQGGTFNPQTVNPFVRAQNATFFINDDREQYQSSGQSTPTNPRPSRVGSWPTTEVSRGAPFLSGVLNLRGREGDPRPEDENNDEQPLLAGEPSNTSPSPSGRSSPEGGRLKRIGKSLFSAMGSGKRPSEVVVVPEPSSNTSSNNSLDNASTVPLPSLSSDRLDRDYGIQICPPSSMIGVAALPNEDLINRGADVARGDFIV